MSLDANKIIVALDHANFDECKTFVEKVGSSLRFVKIGSILFSSVGPQILEYFSKKNVKIFLDLKYHDIPNTVSHSISGVLQHAFIDMLTIHASGGREMIFEAKQAIQESGQKTELLAVTILTSLDQKNLTEIGFAFAPHESVVNLANLAIDSGADGIVCSSAELEIVRKRISKKMTIVVPGIRPAFQEKAGDDQKRTATPEYAFEKGASYIVVGRPITQAENPAEVLEKIVQGSL